MQIENEILRLLHRHGISDIKRCVLLVGAGLSSSGVMPDGTGLPTWDKLTALMLNDLSVLGRMEADKYNSLKLRLERNEAENFLYVASYYKEQTDDAEFDRFFRDCIDPPGLRPSIMHEQIIKAGFRAIITTNFDRVLEKAAPQMPTYSYPDYLGRADILQSSETFLLKLHGSIAPPINLKSRLRISKEDYEDLHSSPEYQKTLKGIIAGNPVIAMGYSCQDPDFISVMKDLKKESAVGPFVYVLLREPDIKLVEELRDSNVKVVPYKEHGDIADFFDDLEREEEVREEKAELPSNITAEPRPQVFKQGMPRSRTGAVSSGSLGIDLALGIGGWPRGYIVEIFGPSGSGKTSLVMQAIAEAQRDGGNGALIDADHATDPITAERFGVDIDKLYYIEPSTLEEAWETLDKLVSDNLVDVVAIDSFAALVPEKDIQSQWLNDQEKNTYHRNLINSLLQKLVIKLSRKKAVVLITNQLTEKVGVVFGNPEMTPWETAPLQYYASIRCDLRRVETIKSNNRVIGSKLRLRVTKNRLAAPFQGAEFEVLFDSGIPKESEILTLAFEHGILKRQGSYYLYRDKKFRQDQAIRYLKTNPNTFAELRNEILNASNVR